MPCTCTEGGGLYSHLSDPSSLKIRVLSEISCVIWWIKDGSIGAQISPNLLIYSSSHLHPKGTNDGMLLKEGPRLTGEISSPRLS